MNRLIGNRAPIFYVLFAGVVCIESGCTPRREIEANRTKAVEARKDKVLHDLATRHSASTNWADRLDDSFSVYTINVQRALMGKPAVASRCDLVDIEQKGSDYFIISTPRSPRLLDVLFRLTANKEQIDKLTSAKISQYVDEIAVVVKIDSVTRFRLGIAPQNEESLEVELSDLPFLAEGKLIDFETIKYDDDKKR